jgi:TonB-linked SusC/RagA family outer membrane protein
MKKKLPETSLFILRCMALGIGFQCFLVIGSYAAGPGYTFALNVENDLTPSASQQQNRIVTGTVLDNESDEGIPGVSIVIKGTNTGTVTDVNGAFSIEIPSAESVLVFSSIGYASQEVQVGQLSIMNIRMLSDVTTLGEVIVVGYGEQRKETVIGAVTQTNGKALTRTGGVSTLGAALTGNLPGLVTMASTGMPGEENPQILIRARTTWNNGAQPLILVDGVERPEFFRTMDINAVESISMLKDASATAVFGSRGANGVILITTKRGHEGKAEITATMNTTMKMVSKLPGKLDSYDAMGVRNRAIENELSENPASWDEIIPQRIIDKYRYPANREEAERYPNVDWQNVLFKDFAMAYNANVGIRGGTEHTKYFANLDFQNEGDLFREIQNNRGYEPGYNYNRLNFRNNLDFQITPSTKLMTNLAGTYAVRKSPWGGGNDYNFWIAAYNNPPDLFIPRYSDGFWGYYSPNTAVGQNSVRILSISGLEYTTTASVSTNFTLDQSLDMLVKGLSLKGTLALDNTFVESDRGVNDLYNDIQEKWIDPITGNVVLANAYESNAGFDYYDQGAAWSPSNGVIDGGASSRRLFYQLQVNYATTLAEHHNFTAMGLFNRQEQATGSEVPRYREDWVFRTTYNFKNKYMVEYNGAYNGSEKFAPEYRFAFFSSGGLGWVISEENFMQQLSFINNLKVRASYGEVGDDNISGRWLFRDLWSYGESAKLGTVGWLSEYSPYTWYRQSSVGNASVRWETVYKYNVGLDFGFFNGLIEGSVDFFRDDRNDILMAGGDRAVPSYFGMAAPAANLGRMQGRGFELTVKFNHTLGNGLRLWADFSMTHAKDKVIRRDDRELLRAYQQAAGYALGQTKTHVSSGYYNTWDELYASTTHNTNNDTKIPGNYNIVDYNGDGMIDNLDAAPFGFSANPQNTYNTNVGIEWKGFSLFLQFYGVNNVTRQVVFNSLAGGVNRVYDEGSYWSKDDPTADVPMPRWKSLTAGYNVGTRYFYDGSYLRLKNAEIAYRFDNGWVNKIGMQSLRVYLSGNNLLLWTKMPDDREANFAGTGWASQGAYPTVKRVNLGLNLTF